MIPKRTFWVGVGYSAGVASTFYVRRRVRRAVGPRALDAAGRTRDAAGRARDAVRGVRVAVSEGRAAMRETERELRAEYETPRTASPGSSPAPTTSGSVKRIGR